MLLQNNELDFLEAGETKKLKMYNCLSIKSRREDFSLHTLLHYHHFSSCVVLHFFKKLNKF